MSTGWPLEAHPNWVSARRGGTCCAGRLGLQAVPLLPDLQYDLAAGVPARDPGQRLAGLVQRQHLLDLGTQRAVVDQAAECLQPLPAAMGGERFAGDAPIQLSGRTLQDYGYHPAAVADRTNGLVAGLAPGAVQQQVDAAGNRGPRLLDQSAAW